MMPHPFDVPTLMQTARDNWRAVHEARALWLEGMQAMHYTYHQWLIEAVRSSHDLRPMNIGTDPQKIAEVMARTQNLLDRTLRHHDEIQETWHQSTRESRRLVEERLSGTLAELGTALKRKQVRNKAA
jgi:hypothetical protein